MSILSEIQKKLKVPKNLYNSFGKYYYRSAEGILDAAKKILPEGCKIILDDQIVLIGDRYYIRSTASMVCYGTIVSSSSAFAREPLAKKGMDESQITGSASSYARKYALGGLFAIDDGQDADSIPSEEFINEAEKEKIDSLIKELQVDKDKFLKYMKVNKIDEVAAKDFTKALAALEQKRKKGGKK